ASASTDRTVRLWDVATGAALQTLEGHSGWVNVVAFSPDGRLMASASDDRTVRLWDTATGAALQTLKVYTVIRSLFFSSDGLYLETDRGQLDISPFSGTISLQSTSLKELFFIRETWVTFKEENVLWLPSDYRVTCSAVRNNILVLGHESGRVTFLELNLPDMPSGREL
ncbi:WD40 repeat-like protein, partial [Lepidopterella palustris CBS 459.81]